MARSLLTRAGGIESAERVADSADLVCGLLMTHLARLVGVGGAQALVRRSLSLTRAEHPWLVQERVPGDDEQPWPGLRGALAGQPVDVAIGAFSAWYSNLIDLLERFIGDVLVARMLHEIWPDVVPPPAKESS